MEETRRIHDYKIFKQDSETIWTGPFYFIQAADTQFGLIERYIEKKEVFGWEKEKVLAKLCVEKLNRLTPKPRFFVICGDLCDAFPEMAWEMRKEQEKDFWEIFKKVDPTIPLICVCGNHDIGDQPTVTSVERYRSSFGNDYFSFWVGGVLFIVINSQYYFNSTQVSEISNEQDLWLDKQLKLSLNSKHGAIIFQHIPWFTKNPEDKTDDYFCIPYNIRKSMLEKLYKAGVRYVFAGHLHRNSGGFYNDLECIVTSAVGGQLGDDKSGFRIVYVKEDKVEHKYFEFEEVPENISI